MDCPDASFYHRRTPIKIVELLLCSGHLAYSLACVLCNRTMDSHKCTAYVLRAYLTDKVFVNAITVFKGIMRPLYFPHHQSR